MASVAAGSPAAASSPAEAAGRSIGAPESNPSEPGGATDRFHAVADRFEAARAKADRVHAEAMQALSDIPTSGGPGSRRRAQGELQRAIDQACAAEIEAADRLIEAIRDATPAGGVDGSAQSFRHRDGRLFIALPGLDTIEIDGRDEYVLIIPAGRQGGIAPVA
jgi:hypothetical protein